MKGKRESHRNQGKQETTPVTRNPFKLIRGGPEGKFETGRGGGEGDYRGRGSKLRPLKIGASRKSRNSIKGGI